VTGEAIGTGTVSARAREPLAGAYFWVLAFFVVYCSRPEDWIPGVSHLHLAKIVGGFALIAFVMSAGSLKNGLPKITTLLILLVGQMMLASLFSPVWKGGAFQTTLGFAKVVLIILVMAVAVTSLPRLRRLIFVQSACVAVVATISVRESQVAGRLQGALNGIYQNPNDLALAIVLTLPFCAVFLLNGRNGLSKVGWSVACLVMVYALLRTGSRAGLLALIVAAGICLWEFGIRGRRPHLLLIAVAASGIIFAVAGQRVIQRFSNTTQYEGNGAAYESAQLRQGLLVRSLKLTLEHPLFGIGPGDFPVISGAWQETHDVYTEFSAEAGIPALVLFLMIYWYALKQLHELKQREPEESEPAMFAAASRAGLIAFAIAAFFYPDAYQFFLYFVLGYATALNEISLRNEPANIQSKNPARPGVRTSIFGAAGGLEPVSEALPVNLRVAEDGQKPAPQGLPADVR
jgi:O-antigen ligase